MEAVSTISQTLSSAGLWGIIAILTVAIVYLWKQINDLNTEMRKLQDSFYGRLETNSREIIKAMNDNSNALSQLEQTIQKLKN